MKQNNTIPLIVDDVKDLDNFKMTRFTYFNLETADYLADIKLDLLDIEFPVTTIGLQGIITQPLNKSEFTTVKSINDLFDRIEKTEEFFIDTNDIWLPNTLFKRVPTRGEMIRVSKTLFRVALAFREDKMTYNSFNSQVLELVNEVSYSPKEEKVFREWFKLQIDLARDKYYDTPKKNRLKYNS